MQYIGVILILVVIALYVVWILYTRKQEGVSAKKEAGAQTFDILVKGVYSPGVIKAKAGEMVRINFRREEDADCSRFVNFPDFRIRKELPRGETVTIELLPEKEGEYEFACDMDMYKGKLIIEK